MKFKVEIDYEKTLENFLREDLKKYSNYEYKYIDKLKGQELLDYWKVSAYGKKLYTKMEFNNRIRSGVSTDIIFKNIQEIKKEDK